jgi:type IV secretory pathway VirJ component
MRKCIYITFALALIIGTAWWALPGSVHFSESTVPSEEFGSIQIFTPDAAERAALLFIEGSKRDSLSIRRAIRRLLDQRAVVFLLDADVYLKNLQDDKDCNFIGGAIERLGQSLESSMKLPAFIPPVMIGVGRGALLAYVARLHSPNRFPGTLAYDFCPRFSSRISMCSTDHLKFRVSGLDSYAWYDNSAGAIDSLRHNFYVRYAQSCPLDPTLEMLAPGMDTLAAAEPLLSAIERILPLEKQAATGYSAIPLIELEAKSTTPRYLAVFLSGDGGWAGIDEDTGSYLREHGVSVLGLSSLRYFWDKKTPEKTAADIQSIFDIYSKKWKLDRFLLIGYSLGADAVPLIYNRLSEETKAKVARIAMIAPENRTDLQVHITDWLGGAESDTGIGILPEIERIPSRKVLCIWGEDDASGACGQLNPNTFSVLKLPGGHHFDGDYKRLGKEVLAGLAD